MTTFHPLTPEHWQDFEKLFGPRGACGGCLCMYWRLSRTQYDEQQGELNRRKGLTVQLLQAAVDFAKSKGARIIEGYPVEPKDGKAPDVFVYTGLASAFTQAGFTEVARRSETRPIMRYYL